jgi:hypothetical protein
MLYETRKISLFFFLARGIVSSLCLLEIQTLESSKARKSKDEEAERRTNKKKAKFRAETIISASVKGRKKQLSRTNSTPLFSFLSLSLSCVCRYLSRAMGLRASKPRDAANNATTGTNQQQTPGGLRVRLLPFFLSSSFKSLPRKTTPGRKNKSCCCCCVLTLLLLLLLLSFTSRTADE